MFCRIDLTDNEEKSAKDEKDKKKSVSGGSSRNLWVSGLSSSTRATDLKQVFSKYGKVIGAKVVTNARTPGARCYGYVTMATSDDASKCIQHLHRTELHGRMISVERAKGDASGPPRKSESKQSSSSSTSKRHERRPSSTSTKDGDKKKKEGEDESEKHEGEEDKGTEAKDDSAVDGAKAEGDENNADAAKQSGEDKGKEERKSRERRERSHYSHHSRSPHRSSRKPGVLTFTQIRDERERQRLREKERELREEQRRHRDEIMRHREIDRRHREEAMRLEREKEKLRLERERIERDRCELMRLERERQRHERERLEREREELKRQQMRLDETRRSVKRPPSTERHEAYPEDRKRVALERRFDVPGRFDDGARFERGPTFRVRDDRHAETDHRTKVDIRHSRDRYAEPAKAEGRYADRTGDTWHAGGGPPPTKSYNSMGSGGGPPRDSWGPSGERKAEGQGIPIKISGCRLYADHQARSIFMWVTVSGGPMGAVGPGPMYSSPQNVASNMSSMNMGMSGGGNGPYGGDRFDAYKQSMGAIRKY
ncbi:hypothetical protein C0J52_20264 [Blattella germanica]|nr:hypothetical protein C0J52_20264 [Blattella germanica]